jgi:ABC-type dipeptide/oligopeptide/nickel transport system permease component/ABC-type antimicrobial peptide transport system permease subunit
MDNPKLRAALFFPRRIVWLFLTFLVMMAVIFAFMRAGVGDPARMLGPGPPSDQAEDLGRQLGLDQPAWKQYARYLGGTLRGEFGSSMRTGRPVKEEIAHRLPSTLRLLGLATLVGMILSVFIILVGVPVLLVRDQVPILGAIFQRLGQMGVTLGVAMPAFILGLFLVYFFAFKLGWFPPGGWAGAGSGRAFNLNHALLPVFTLATLPACLVARSVLGEIAYYRATGTENHSVLLLHATLSFFGYGLIQAIGMLGGALVVESVFALPGVGRLFVESIFTQDYPLGLGLVTSFLIWALILRALADLVKGIDAFVLLKLKAIEPEAAAPTLVGTPSRAKVLGLVWIAFCLLLIIVPFFQGVGGFLVSRDRIMEQSLADRNLPPGSESVEGFTYAWGTDALGRDIRSRARYALGLDLGSSLLIALVVLVPALLGGLLAGYLAKKGALWADVLDDLVMFPAEVLTSLPGLILLAFILSTTGSGLRNLLVWLALAFLLPRGVRIVRGWWVSTSPERVPWLRLMGIALGVLVLSTGLAVVTQPVVGFLGLGVQPPQPDLGAMLGEGLNYMRVAPYGILRPGQALLLAAFGWFLLADTLLSRFGIHKREAWLELNR